MTLRECPYCKQSLPLSEFPSRNARCKPCKAVHDKGRARTDPRNPNRNATEAARARKRRWQSMNYDPAKNQARHAVHQAVANGTIAAPTSCEKCGASPTRRDGKRGVQAHHHDGYDRPLSVQWLCAVCHRQEHAALAGQRRGGGVVPRKVYLPRDKMGPQHSGIDVTWTPTSQRLDFGGWYDSFVGLPPDSMTLRQFFDLLGISKADCRKAWREGE